MDFQVSIEGFIIEIVCNILSLSKVNSKANSDANRANIRELLKKMH